MFGFFGSPRVSPPRPSLGASLLLVPARFGRTGQLGLPSCLFVHASSWEGWVGFPRVVSCCSSFSRCALGVACSAGRCAGWSLLRCPLLCLLLRLSASCPGVLRCRVRVARATTAVFLAVVVFGFCFSVWFQFFSFRVLWSEVVFLFLSQMSIPAVFFVKIVSVQISDVLPRVNHTSSELQSSEKFGSKVLVTRPPTRRWLFTSWAAL